MLNLVQGIAEVYSMGGEIYTDKTGEWK